MTAGEPAPPPHLDDQTAPVKLSAISPYAGGGGGSVFAHRVAAVYVGQMLLGEGRIETRERPIVGVAFQTNPVHEVDDLLVTAGDSGEEIRVNVAVRRAPRFVGSHAKTRSLVASLVREVEAHLEQDDHHVAVAVAGNKPEYEQVQQLAQIVRDNASEATFYAQLHTDGRWDGAVRGRYDHLRTLVGAGLPTPPSEDQARTLTWQLLQRLWIVPLRVETADESDWALLGNALNRLAREGRTGVELRDRLADYCAQSDLGGAVLDARLVRRELHSLLHADAGRQTRGWQVLRRMRTHAREAVRESLGDPRGDGLPMSLDRAEKGAQLAEAVLAAGHGQTAVVVHGASGTGKSALVLRTVDDLQAQRPEVFEALVLNLRRLPETLPALTTALGQGLVEFLSDLSAPARVLVVDAADAASEGRVALLHELAVEARSAGVGLVVVTADSAVELVVGQVDRSYTTAARFVVDLLDDAQLQTVAVRSPRLSGVLRNLPAASLLRRLVVLDLLSRSDGALGEVVNDWTCLQLVRTGLIRRGEDAAFGSPEARERAMLAMAEDQLGLPQNTRRFGRPDDAAVDALRRDQLVAPSGMFDDGPQFAHDEVRRYAAALRLARTPEPGDLLDRAGAPRWALSAAQLACLGHLERSDVDPVVAFAAAARGFAGLAARHGERWADVPVEAALESRRARAHLQALMPPATALPDDVDLQRVLRVVSQRHDEGGLLDVQRGEPVVRFLLDAGEQAPWASSKAAFAVMAGWLRSLVVAGAPAGHPTRLLLRRALLDHWSAHDVPTPIIARRGLDPVRRPAADPSQRRRGSRDGHRGLPRALLSEEFVTLLALLGSDIGAETAGHLDTVAGNAPAKLAPAVDAPLTGWALAQHDPDLLVRLAAAYYIDDAPYGRRHDDGVRDHDRRWLPRLPRRSAHYLGPFAPIFAALSLARSAAFLNELLNHAACVRDRLLEADDDERGSRGVVLRIDGSARTYRGDVQVWSWYRGSAVGPIACSSALQAMELALDERIAADVPLAHLADVLLDGCENLAVPGLLVGVAVRHLERADGVIDRFLREPDIWHLEAGRITYDMAGFRGSEPAAVVNEERRRWAPLDVAARLVLGADETRRAELARVGEELRATGRAAGTGPEVEVWADHLDASRMRVCSDGDGDRFVVGFESAPDVAEQQAGWAEDSRRTTDLLRIQNRYSTAFQRRSPDRDSPTTDEIAADLALARALAADPPALPGTDPFLPLAHVAAAAVRRAADGDPAAFGGDGAFVVELFVGIREAYADLTEPREDHQHFDLGADRTVAAALPCLVLSTFRGVVEEAGYSADDVDVAALAVAHYAPAETRLFLSRGCDRLWNAPCDGEPCVHRRALRWATESARFAEIGPWDPDGYRRALVRIEGDVVTRLRELDGDAIDAPALDAAIRACGAAASTNCCVASDAVRCLAVLLDVQRRAVLRTAEDGLGVEGHGGESLVTARALLQTCSFPDAVEPLLGHLTALSDDADLLTDFLHSLAGAGAESTRLAQVARSIWPAVVRHVLTFAGGDPDPFQDGTWGSWALGALLPQPLVWSDGIHNEVEDRPIDWFDAAALLDLVPAWLALVRGRRRCLDDLIAFLLRLSSAQQVDPGLAWVREVCTDGNRVLIDDSSTLVLWLIELRPAAEGHGQLQQWQHLVDTLATGGYTRLAPYSV